jgi:hypothetical protein
MTYHFMIKYFWMIIHKNWILIVKAEADFLNTWDCFYSAIFFLLPNFWADEIGLSAHILPMYAWCGFEVLLFLNMCTRNVTETQHERQTVCVTTTIIFPSN